MNTPIQIKFGTDGWRAIIAQEFTVDNVKRVAYATALWLKENHTNPSVVVGNDCRFAGKLFAETTASIFAQEGIKVYLSENEFVSTPMVSLGTVNKKAQAGIIITASHNPPEYNGYKIKAHYGGPAVPSEITRVEELIPDTYTKSTKNIQEYQQEGLIEYINLEDMYVEHAENCFDIEAIKNSGLNLAYDAMYGQVKM
jgi:phosphomannomutase